MIHLAVFCHTKMQRKLIDIIEKFVANYSHKFFLKEDLKTSLILSRKFISHLNSLWQKSQLVSLVTI